MIDADRFASAAYVAAAAPLVGLHLKPELAAEVAVALAIVARFAGPALNYPLPPESEPAPVFVP